MLGDIDIKFWRYTIFTTYCAALHVPKNSDLDLPEVWNRRPTLGAVFPLHLHPYPLTRAGQETEMWSHNMSIP